MSSLDRMATSQVRIPPNIKSDKIRLFRAIMKLSFNDLLVVGLFALMAFLKAFSSCNCKYLGSFTLQLIIFLTFISKPKA